VNIPGDYEAETFSQAENQHAVGNGEYLKEQPFAERIENVIGIKGRLVEHRDGMLKPPDIPDEEGKISSKAEKAGFKREQGGAGKEKRNTQKEKKSAKIFYSSFFQSAILRFFVLGLP
jgi:hypothetical protein